MKFFFKAKSSGFCLKEKLLEYSSSVRLADDLTLFAITRL
jgi:hypothetical protein